MYNTDVPFDEEPGSRMSLRFDHERLWCLKTVTGVSQILKCLCSEVSVKLYKDRGNKKIEPLTMSVMCKRWP